MNNAEFLVGLRNHDPDAARHLKECFLPTVWRFVFARVQHDQHLAEDIVSESVLALIAAVAEGIEIEYPTAWMRCVAQRKVQDHFRAAARVQHLIEQVSAISPGETCTTPATEHDANIQREEVRASMDRLPEPYRLALEWKYVDRLSVREIAERLDTTEKSAESILFRARSSFREEHRRCEEQVERTSKRPENHATERAHQDVTDNDHDHDEDERPSLSSKVTRTRP